MAEDDRVIRELYAEAAAGPRTDHPDDAAWEALALAELPAAQKEGLLDHVTRCAECATIYRGLNLLASEAAAFDAAVPRAPQRRPLPWPRKWVYAGLAAAAAVVLVTLVPVQPGHSPSPTPAASDPVRSPEKAVPVPVAPTGRLSQAPREFRWQSMPGSRRYRVELSNAEGERLWTSPPVAATTVAWPPALSPAPGVYYWLVTALPDADVPLSAPTTSALASFEIATP